MVLNFQFCCGDATQTGYEFVRPWKVAGTNTTVRTHTAAATTKIWRLSARGCQLLLLLF